MRHLPWNAGTKQEVSWPFCFGIPVFEACSIPFSRYELQQGMDSAQPATRACFAFVFKPRGQGRACLLVSQSGCGRGLRGD